MNAFFYKHEVAIMALVAVVAIVTISLDLFYWRA